MTDTEYLPASEIAQRAGITRQTVHNRAKGKWRQYAKEIDGLLYVSVKVLSNEPLQPEQEFDSDLTQKIDTSLTADCQADCQTDTPEPSNPVKNLSNEWAAIVDVLKADLDNKNAEIERLRADLAAERTRSADLERRLLEYADRFADMAEREQELTRNAQQLHAIAEVRNDPPELPDPETEEPRGFFARLFGRAGK